MLGLVLTKKASMRDEGSLFVPVFYSRIFWSIHISEYFIPRLFFTLEDMKIQHAVSAKWLFANRSSRVGPKPMSTFMINAN